MVHVSAVQYAPHTKIAPELFSSLSIMVQPKIRQIWVSMDPGFGQNQIKGYQLNL